jgi:hypothetical protein
MIYFLPDIKLDNIMITSGRWTTEAIDSWIRENPPCTYAPERSLNGMVSAFVSQSFPPLIPDELLSCNFTLAGFSNGSFNELFSFSVYNLFLLSAQFVSDQTTHPSA